MCVFENAKKTMTTGNKLYVKGILSPVWVMPVSFNVYCNQMGSNHGKCMQMLNLTLSTPKGQFQ